MTDQCRIHLPIFPLEDSGVEGFLRIGPLPEASIEKLPVALLNHGLQVSSEGAVGAWVAEQQDASGMSGYHFIQNGPGVLGYLVDDEGCEAFDVDIARCIASIVTHPTQVSVLGRHDHDGSAAVRTHVRITIREDGFDVTREQTIGQELETDPGLDVDTYRDRDSDPDEAPELE